MGMDIKKTDTKGRVTVGTKGEAYSQTVQPDGTIILKPLIPPKPPVMPEDAPHAIYVDYRKGVSTLTVHSKVDASHLAIMAADLATENGQIPIVVNSSGANAAMLDIIQNTVMDRGSFGDIKVIGVRPADKDRQEFRDKIINGLPNAYPRVDASGLLTGKTRILHFGEDANWLPPVSMHAFFGAAGIDANRVINAEITDMPSDYYGSAKTGLIATLIARQDDEKFFKGVAVKDGEPSTFRAIIPLVPSPTNGNAPRDAEGSTAPQSAGPMRVPEERQPVDLSEHTIAKLTDAVATKLETGIAEKGDADNSAPSAEFIWDRNNACPWDCRYRHVHVARRSDDQGYWRPRTAGELRRVTPDAEPTDGTTADADRPPMSAREINDAIKRGAAVPIGGGSSDVKLVPEYEVRKHQTAEGVVQDLRDMNIACRVDCRRDHVHIASWGTLPTFWRPGPGELYRETQQGNSVFRNEGVAFHKDSTEE